MNSIAPERAVNLYFGPQGSDSLVEPVEEKDAVIKILDILQTRFPLHQPTSEGNRVSISESIQPVHNRERPTLVEAIQSAYPGPVEGAIRQGTTMHLQPMSHNLPYHQLPSPPSSFGGDVLIEPGPPPAPINGKRPYSSTDKENKAPSNKKRPKEIALSDDLRDQLREFYKNNPETVNAIDEEGVTWAESDDDRPVLDPPRRDPLLEYVESGGGKRRLNPEHARVPYSLFPPKRAMHAQPNAAKRKASILKIDTGPRSKSKAGPKVKRVKVRDVVIDEIPL